MKGIHLPKALRARVHADRCPRKGKRRVRSCCEARDEHLLERSYRVSGNRLPSLILHS